MRNKLIPLILIVFGMLLCTGCYARELEYDMNYGYDLSHVKNKDITFNVYHTNDTDHSWELIASFPCDPQPGHYYDVKLECGGGSRISAVMKDTQYTRNEDGAAVAYDDAVAATYEFDVEGFGGTLSGWEFFAVRDMQGEQLVRLYPVSNSSDVFYLTNIGLDQPYDTEGETLDDILITIVMN